MTWPLAILAGWAAWRLIDRPLPPRRLIELAKTPWLGLVVTNVAQGLRIDGYRGAVHINRARLPPDVDELVIKGLLVGHRQIDLTFHRVGNGVVAYSDDFFDGSIPVLQHA
jgi:hypothetical protein